MGFCSPSLGIQAEWLVFFVTEKDTESPECAGTARITRGFCFTFLKWLPSAEVKSIWLKFLLQGDEHLERGLPCLFFFHNIIVLVFYMSVVFVFS